MCIELSETRKSDDSLRESSPNAAVPSVVKTKTLQGVMSGEKICHGRWEAELVVLMDVAEIWVQ